MSGQHTLCRDADELKLLAGILRRLGRSNITPPQCDDIAEKMESVAHHLEMADKSKMVTGAFAEEASTTRRESATLQAIAASNRAARIPKAPSVPPALSTASAGLLASGAGAAAPTSSRQRRPSSRWLSIGASPRQPQRSQQLSDSSLILGSSAASQRSGASVPHTSGAAPKEPSQRQPQQALHVSAIDLVQCENEINKIMPASLYVLFEGIIDALQATSGAIYVPYGDEMVSVCNVSSSLAFPPSLLRHTVSGAITSGVFASGVALHQSTVADALDDSGRKARSMLIFPIWSRRRATVDSPRRVIAVVEVSNKFRGKADFTSEDESFLCCACRLLAFILERHSVDWANRYFDPVALHRIAPFEPREMHFKIPVIATVQKKRNSVVEVRDMIPSDFTVSQLIHRTTVPISLAKRQTLDEGAAPIGVAPSLSEIDSYLSNLTECWRKSVAQNAVLTASENSNLEQMKKLRAELARRKQEVQKLAEEVKLRCVDTSDYCREYSTLKEELEAFIRSKAGEDDEE